SLYPSDEYVEITAYHYARTQDPEAADWLERAGDRAARTYANDSAIAHYADAADRLNATSPAIAARLDEKLGTVLTAGRYDEALTRFDRAADVYKHHRDLESAGRVTAALGMTHRYRFSLDEGIGRVQPMIDLLSWSGPSEALAALYISLANLYFSAGAYAETLSAAEQATEIAQTIGNDRLRGEAEERRGSALGHVRGAEEGVKILEDAIPLIEASGDLLALFRAVNNLGYYHWLQGRMDLQRPRAAQGVDLAVRAGNPDQLIFSLVNASDVYFYLGDWSTAEEYVRRAAAVPGSGSEEHTLLKQQGQLAMCEGRWDEAARLLTRAVATAVERGTRQGVEQGEAAAAELTTLRGNAADAVRRLAPLAGDENVDAAVLPALGWAYTETGDLDAAESIISRCLSHLPRHGRIYLPDTLRALGLLRRRQGRPDEAARALTEGLEVARGIPYPYAEARILADLGELLMDRGETREAREHLDEALGIFERLGAAKDVERVETLLGGVGVAVD
ncbi:MAG: tetratricopeptide repeat protein, partial [Chloroflexota bacterium]